MRLHPPITTLSRFLADELPRQRRLRTAQHLASCSRCRQRVRELRATTDALREAPVPELPDNLLDRVMERRAAGERIILPVAAPAEQKRKATRWVAALAAGVVLAIVGSLSVGRTPELAASASELTISPQTVRAGQPISVEYRAAGKLAGERQLVLRARLATRSNRDSHWYARVGVLRRQPNGLFRGTFVLPDSVVYAALAVEDTSGARVDYSPAEWDLLVHGADGRPLFAALEQQTNYRQEWNTELAMQAARAVTQTYPDSADGWYSLFAMEESVLSEMSRDSLNTVYRKRFRALEEALQNQSRPDPGQMATLRFFASALDDTAAAQRWGDRLIETSPRHIAAAQLRVFRINEAHGRDLPRFFAELERLWEEVGATSGQLIFTGFIRAEVAGDEKELRRWGDRLYAAYPQWRAAVVRAYGDAPGLRSEALVLLRNQIRQLDDDAEDQRQLGESRDEHRRVLRSAKGFFLGQLGRALLAEGQQPAALDTLARAVEISWNVELQRALAEARLVVGDTSGALAAFARVAADPTTSAAFEDSVRQRVGRRFLPDSWMAARADGQREMMAFIWNQAVDRGVAGPIRLTDAGGRSRVFEKESDGPTFVAFWSRHCPPSLMQLGELQRLYDTLSSAGVRVLTITEGESPEQISAFLKENGYTFPVLLDADHYAARAFDNRVTPRYLLLDPSGRIRFISYSPTDVIRQVLALRGSD